MSKTLRITFPKKCIGCELCVFEVQRQLKKVGLEGSYIRIFRKTEEDTDTPNFVIDMEPQVNSLDVKRISQICPTAVFTVEDGESNELVN